MKRNKPYGKGWAIFEVLLLLFTGGFWIFVIIPRELYRWSK